MLVKIEYDTGRTTTFDGRAMQQTGLLTFFVNQVLQNEGISARSVLLQFNSSHL